MTTDEMAEESTVGKNKSSIAIANAPYKVVALVLTIPDAAKAAYITAGSAANATMPMTLVIVVGAATAARSRTTPSALPTVDDGNRPSRGVSAYRSRRMYFQSMNR